MIVKELIQLIDGKVLNKSVDLSHTVVGCGGADLMSDVLASVQSEAVLITGLCNPQVVRTALMADLTAIILVRGKQPPDETIDLAETEGIPLILTPHGMFEVCGRLYRAGLESLELSISNGDCSTG